MMWILLIFGLLLFLYLHLIKLLQYWKRLGVPQYSLIQVLRDILEIFRPTCSFPELMNRIYNDFPELRYIGVYQLIFPVIHIRDPELIKQITIKDFDHFTDHTEILSEETEPIWPKTLIALKGDKWKSMRILLSPTFTSRKLKLVYPLLISCVKQMTDYCENKCNPIHSLEMQECFHKLTCDVIATSAYGISRNSFEDSNNEFFVMAMRYITDVNQKNNFKNMIKMFFPKLANILNIQIIDKTIPDFFGKIITENIKDREIRCIVRSDLIQLLLEAKKKTERVEEDEEDEILHNIKDEDFKIKKIQLTDDDILAQAFMFFFIGFQGIALFMSFLAHELALQTEIQDKLYNEIQEHIAEFGEDPTYESLMKMKYLNMVILENLRKVPVTGVERICTKSYTIQPTSDKEKPVHLSAGQQIYIASGAIHNDPKYFPNPTRFDPERFSDENKSKIIPGTYLPFGIGPRHCIANRFALMQMKLAFYYIVSKFKIVVIDKTQIPLKMLKSHMSINAEGGFWLGLEKREI